MSWVQLYLVVEGDTELKFAKDTLCPHLKHYDVVVNPRKMLSNSKLGTGGGAVNFDRFKWYTGNLMKADARREARFSMMLDLFRLPAGFPGWQEAEKHRKANERVLELEKALAREIGDSRFIPFLQLHEFEALLYCDLTQVQSRIPGSEKAIAALQQEVAGFGCPEDINDGATTPPSQRLIHHVPRYKKLKVSVGAVAAAAVGLPTLRQKCPHFGRWLESLENLAK